MDIAMAVATDEQSSAPPNTVTQARSVWTITGPTAWPSLPSPMSFTTLRDIETCPLRWGLRKGTYPSTWVGKGYPPVPATATITGQVVHVALELIVQAVAEARDRLTGELGTSSVASIELVVTGLRAVGGISAVLERVIRETVAGWEANPRLRPRAKELATNLQRQLPTLRLRVQQFMHGLDMSQINFGRVSIARGRNNWKEASARPLGSGVHAEVPMMNDELAWYGKADLVRIGAGTGVTEGDEIVDFKTGLAKPDHSLQLRIYALLWAREKRLNPAGRRARKLTILYADCATDVEAPVTDEDLDGVAREVAERTERARNEVQHMPLIARPSGDACKWCDVRHMCAAYWTPETRAAVRPPIESAWHQVDAGVLIIHNQGSWSWIASVREIGALSDEIALGARVLLRARPHDEHFTSLIAVGMQLRIVAAQMAPPSDESGGLPVFALTSSSEVFRHALN